MRKRFDARATVTASLLLLMLLGVSLVILSGHLPKEVIGGTGRSAAAQPGGDLCMV
jgi:hypothetical protein